MLNGPVRSFVMSRVSSASKRGSFTASSHSCDELLHHRHRDPSLLLHRDPLRSFFTETPFTRKAMGKEDKPRVHPCPHCLTGFRSPSERDRHARAVHEKWRDYKCPHCSTSQRGCWLLAAGLLMTGRCLRK